MSNLKVRTRLALILIIVLLPLILAQAINLYTVYNQVFEQELNANQDFAQAIALIFTNHLLGVARDLDEFSRELVYLAQDTDSFNSYLHKKQRIYADLFTSIGCLDVNGIIIASSLPEAIGEDYSDRSYFHAISNGALYYASEVLIGKKNNSPTVVVARPVKVNSEVQYILAASLNLDFLEKIMPPKRVGATSSFGLADPSGIIVFREGHPQVVEQMITVHPQGAIRRVLDTGKTIRLRKVDSVLVEKPLLAVAKPIPEIGWVAYANSDYRAVVAAGLASLRVNFIALGATSVLSAFFIFYLFRTVVRPIMNLQHFAQEIARGNLATRAVIPGKDELAATGHALNQMAERIKALEEERRLFLQTSAHELRNPLTGIKGIIQLLAMRLPRDISREKAIQMLAVAEQEVERVRGILEDMTRGIKLPFQAEHKQYTWDNIDLREIVDKVTEVFQLTAKKHKLQVHRGRQRLFVHGDAEKLEIVLRNILDNAVKYSFPSKGAIVVTLKSKPGKVVISVTDQGAGIPPEDLEKIFTSFYRSKLLHQADPGGMGLGLHICREIIEDHGGQIWAESAGLGQGSTFFFELPLSNV